MSLVIILSGLLLKETILIYKNVFIIFFSSKIFVLWEWLNTFFLTMAKPRRVRVNSGPNEKMSLRMEERINDLIAIGVGIVITMAADTNRKTQIKPEMWGPESETKN